MKSEQISKRPALVRELNTPQPSPEASPTWEAISTLLQAASWSDLARKTGLHPASISRARRDPHKPLSEGERRKLLRALAYRFSDQAALLAWLELIGWVLHFGDEAFLAGVFQEVADLPEVHRLPRYLVPRPELERRVLEAILPDQPHAIGELPPLGVVVSGIGGIGKSTLVRAALRGQGRLKIGFPDGVYWLPCTRLKADQVLEELAGELGAAQKLPQTAAAGRLRRVLRDLRALFILDDVSGLNVIQAILDQSSGSGCRFIFTTRQKIFPVDLDRLRLAAVPAPDFSIDQALQLVETILHKTITGKEREQLTAIIQRVDAHPLALESLAMLVQASALTWEQVHQRLDRQDLTSTLERIQECFDLTYERLEANHPLAARCFRSLGAFPFPSGLMAILHQVTDLEEAEDWQALHKLAEYNLVWIGFRHYHQVWQTHALVSDYAAVRLAARPEEYQAVRERYVQTLLQEMTEADSQRFTEDDKVSPSTKKVFEVHLLSDEICDLVNRALEAHDFPAALHLVFDSYTSLAIYGKYLVPACRQVQAIIQEYPGEPSPEVSALFKKAQDYQRQFEELTDLPGPSIAEILQTQAEPEEKARQLLGMCNRFLIAAHWTQVEQILEAVDELSPPWSSESAQRLLEDYYMFRGDLAFLRGDDAAGLSAYARSGTDWQHPDGVYQHFHARPRKHLALLERVVRALLEQSTP